MEHKKRRIEFRGQSKHMVSIKLTVAIAGLTLYVLNGGTLMYAVAAFVLFGIMVELATAGYHRWITHNALEPTTIGRYIIWFCMVSVGSLRPSTYAVIHRVHHKFSDTEQDPHPPTLGFFNCLMGNYDSKKVTFSVPVLDLYRKKDIVFVDRYFWYLYSLTVVMFACISVNLMLLSFPFLVLRYHIHSAVFNYVAHGGRHISAPQNLKLLPRLFFWGEHLHLNHHLNQNKANYGSVSKYNFDYMYFLLHHLKIIRN